MFPGLLRKDFLLIKNYAWLWLILVLAVYGCGLAVAAYYGEFFLVFPFLFFIYFFHVALLPITEMILLKAEEKGQYWLHSTAGGVKLLLSKILVSLFLFIISLILADVLALISLNIALPQGFINTPEGEIPYKEGFLLNIGLTAGALYFTIWGLFLWAVYHSLNAYPFIKKIRWGVVIAVYLFFQWITAKLLQIPFIQKWFASWTVNISESGTRAWGIGGMHFSIENGDIQIWPIILSILFHIALFLAAAWLLNRKVEV
ncbi:hypothetical protein [Pseudobacillus wudalianchiensis]|uniref:Uncharacterized protein n=1 Tax=Pseudobacillus wudalianchiensis TaxID=1743143 RepID=A0A1B9B8N9_9BACI|nr:hypothetical protein [Bacillus wudalianchiensis]OCA92450.1 hypothetical protein A8F95_01705 [Bacillus wudalianchiensis]